MATSGPGGPNLGVGKGGGPTIRSFKLAPTVAPTPLILTPPDITVTFRPPLYTNPRGPEYHVSLRSWAGIKTSTGALVGVQPVGTELTDLPLKLPYEYHIGLRTFIWTQTLILSNQPDLDPNKTFRGPLYTTPRAPEYSVLLRSSFGRLPPAGALAPFAQDDWPVPRGFTYPVDIRTITASYNPNLIGQDVLPTGEVTTALPVKAYEYRAQVHHWSWSYNLNLIGRDRLPVGKELTDLAPRPYTQPIDIRTITTSYNFNLVGQDIFPPGERSTDLARGYEHHIQLRTWTWQYNPNLIAQDAFPPGKDLLDRPPLAPTLLQTWVSPVNLPLTTVVTAPFIQDDWPVSREFRELRSWSWSYNLNLVGQDFVPGKTITDRPALAPALLQTWVNAVNLALTTVSVAPPFSQDYWPLTPAALRGTDLGTWISQTKLLLAVPFSQTDWPVPKPLAPAARSYTSSYNLNLIGQDAFPIGRELYDVPAPRDYSNQLRQWFGAIPPIVTVVAAPFSQTDWQVPKEYRQGRTWLWNYNLNLIGQDQLPSGEATTGLPPRQPQQPTPILIASYNKNLIGQDQLPTGVEVTGLPPQPALSAIQLRTWINATSLALLAGPQVRPFYQTDWPINIGPRQPTPVFTASYNKNLIGQDQLPTGESITWLPQQPLFATQLRTWIQTVNLALQSKVFQLPFNQYDWPLPRAPYRPLPEYSKAFKLPLIGLDVLPLNQYNWPTPAQKIRPLDLLTWINQVSEVLIAPHRQKDWPTPRGYQQPASSYTASYNLNLIGKDALPVRQQYWPLTPDVRRYIDFAVSTNPNILTPPVVVSYTFREPFYTPPRGHIYPALMRSITAGLNLALKVPPAPFPKNQYSWPLPGQPAPLWQRYSYEFQGNVIYWGFINPIPPPPDPTPPEDVRLIYNAGNEWQMLDRIREPGPVGWR